MARRINVSIERRRGLVTMVGLVGALALGGCGASSARDRVRAFVESANRVQLQAQPAIQKANTAYQQFSSGKIAPAAAVAQMKANEALIGRIRARLALLGAPPQALRLKRLLLRLFDANSLLAAQNTLMAKYVPAQATSLVRLAGLDRLLQRSLGYQNGPAGQARGLTAYASGVESVLSQIRRTRPPLIFVPARVAQIRRLVVSHAVALKLRAAILARNPAGVKRLLVQFHAAGVRAANPSLIRAMARDYAKLFSAIAVAQRELSGEEARLDRALK